MSKEIKFRAWERQLKEMVPVVEIDLEAKMINHNSAWRIIDVDVDLMQYTGLKDKNGTEIYEGDILLAGHEPYSNEDNDGNEITEYEHSFKTTVKWDDDAAALVVSADDYGWFGEYPQTTLGWAGGDGEYEFEVIGNIYENPELLK